jgi:dihydrofolate reductase
MLNIIAAMDSNRGIGYRGQLPWPRLQGDLEHFRRLTCNSTVIMGRKTWESLPKRPLAGRVNIVLTRSPQLDGAFPFSSFETAMRFSGNFKRVFVIGGALLFRLALNSGLPLRLHLTRVHGAWPADTHFPFFETFARPESVSEPTTEGDITYHFETWTKE